MIKCLNTLFKKTIETLTYFDRTVAIIISNSILTNNRKLNLLFEFIFVPFFLALPERNLDFDLACLI